MNKNMPTTSVKQTIVANPKPFKCWLKKM